MAGRPIKEGLDYFSLDCHMDDKVKLIQAEFGLKGFAVVVKLLQKIYGEFGYYCEWNEDTLLLFMSENGVNSDSKKMINEIVSACIRRNIFSSDLFERYGVLTSHGIQKRYLLATYERKKVELKKEYLLVSIPENPINVDEKSINRAINLDNRATNTQSKVKESKVNKRKDICRFTPPTADEVRAYCQERNNQVDPERFINFYESKGWMIGKNKMKDWKAAVRTWERKDADQKKAPSNNKFNNFDSRSYNFDDLEKQLLGGGH